MKEKNYTLSQSFNVFTPKETALLEEDKAKSLKAGWGETNHNLWKTDPYTPEEENQKVQEFTNLVLSGLDGVRIDFKERAEIKKELEQNNQDFNKPFRLQTKNPGEYQDREIYIEADGKEVEIYESGNKEYKSRKVPNQNPIILVTLPKDITYKEFGEVLVSLRNKIKAERLEPEEIEDKLENLDYQARLMGYRAMQLFKQAKAYTSPKAKTE